MIHHSVHMRDQKANQLAMLAKIDRQTLINRLEDIAVVVILWGIFLLAGSR